MSENFFPTYNQKRKTGNAGVTFVKKIIEDDFNWIFRPTHLEDDFGIDGYFDIIGKNDSVTGKFLAAQIKTGDSYFSSETSSGWTFNGENKHLNYYLNSEFPILLILVNLSTASAFWVKFDLDKIDKTKNGWSIIIPFTNKLEKAAKQQFIDYTGGIIDYMAQIEFQWEFNKKLKESAFIFLQVSKQEIENTDTSGFTSLLEKLTINDEMIKKTRGKISFSIDGYDQDPREVHEIAQVRKWAKTVFHSFKYWGYFLNMDDDIETITGLRVLHLCNVSKTMIEFDEVTRIKNFEVNKEETLDFVRHLFNWLNEFTEKYKINDKINLEQTKLIGKMTFGLVL